MPLVLPTLSDGITDYRSTVENHVRDICLSEYSNSFTCRKYYNTSNEQIYADALNYIQGGIPAWLLRTRKEEAEDAAPDESLDWKVCSLEVITAVPVAIEKEVRDVDRYAYTMVYLLRELLRKNPVGITRNGKRPFMPVGNRDIFRDGEIDIILSEFQVNYMVI